MGHSCGVAALGVRLGRESGALPHAGGDIAGRRAHAIITRPDLAKRKPSEKETFWLKPASAA